MVGYCIAFACGECSFGFSFAATFFYAMSRVEVHGGANGLGPSSPWTEAAFSEMTHGTACAASASATGQPSAHRSSSPDSSRESGRQSRSCSSEGGENPASSCGYGGHRRSGCRVSEGGVGEGKKKACQRPPLDVEVDECRKFIVRSEKRIAEMDGERESEQSALTNAKARLQRLETEQSVPMEEAPAPADWKAQMEALQAQVNSLREERDQAVHSPAVKRQAVGHVPSRVSGGYSTNAHSGSCRIGQCGWKISTYELGRPNVVLVDRSVYLTGGMAT